MAFVLTLLASVVAWLTSGGDSITGYLFGWLARPTYPICNAILGWPRSDTQFSVGLIALVSTVNALLAALFCMFISAITETWLFLRKR